MKTTTWLIISFFVFCAGGMTEVVRSKLSQPKLSPDDRALLTVTESPEFKALTHSMALAIYSKQQAKKLNDQAICFASRSNYNLDVLDYKLAEMLAK